MELPIYKCSCYCTTFGYDLTKARDLLNIRIPFFDNRRFKEVCVFFDTGDDGEKCIMIFSYGTVTFWGFIQEEENEILEYLKPAETRASEFVEFERFPISLVSGDYDKIKVCGLTLERRGYEQKLAFSFVVAQSVKLNCFEETVENSAGDMHFLSESLSLRGSVSMSKKQMYKKIGEVFLKKNMINLSPEIMDVPEIVWDNDNLEAIYDSAVEYFDISNRMNTLNRRLDTMSDLLLLLSEDLRHRSSERIEFVIVFLILLEAIIAMLELYFYKFKI
ncbi:MAG: RMD1 family protein [Chlamydiia bacterium]|nr:RMD1 family protein [Chlamydiia bacterium]